MESHDKEKDVPIETLESQDDDCVKVSPNDSRDR